MKKRSKDNKTKPFIPTMCRDVQKLNGDFIEGKLPFATARAFVEHVRSCSECMEELKAYFMFYSALRLNDTKEDDLPQDLEVLLKDVEAEVSYIRKRNRNLSIAVLAFLAAVVVLTVLLVNGWI